MLQKTKSATGLGLDLGLFNKSSLGLLNNENKKPQDEENVEKLNGKNKVVGRSSKDIKANSVRQNIFKKEEEKKLGRPMIENDLLNKKLIASVTEEEYNKIVAKAGLVSVSTYLRTKMREAGII
jgi:hypothetical protein